MFHSYKLFSAMCTMHLDPLIVWKYILSQFGPLLVPLIAILSHLEAILIISNRIVSTVVRENYPLAHEWNMTNRNMLYYLKNRLILPISRLICKKLFIKREAIYAYNLHMKLCAVTMIFTKAARKTWSFSILSLYITIFLSQIHNFRMKLLT